MAENATLGQPSSFLRLPQVKNRCALSRSEIYRRVRSGAFPAPIKLGPQTTVWDSAAVDEWIADRIASSTGAAS